MNPKDHTLLLLGRPKTGSTSIWNFLNMHPQIHSSKEKEPLVCKQHEIVKKIPKKEYIKNWTGKDIKEGDILLDASTSWWRFVNIKHCGVQELFYKLDFKNIYCLYVIRRPYITWLRSFLQLHLKTSINKTGPNQFINSEGYINPSQIEKLIYEGHRQELELISELIGMENIYVIEFDNIEKHQNQIYSFLNIDTTVINYLEHYNMTKLNQKRNKLTKNIYLYLKLAKSMIEGQEERDISIIRKRYNFIPGDISCQKI